MVAYEAEGLVVVVRSPGNVLVAPPSEKSRRSLGVWRQPAWGNRSRPSRCRARVERYRVVGIDLGPPDHSLELGLSLAETESTLSQFDRRVAAGGLVFLVLAVAGGIFLSRQALRPVAQSIRTARG